MEEVSGRYYYLMLKDNFFESDDMILLESMENGYLYSNILLKLYLKSLKEGGRLMYKDRIPYNAHMLSKITRHNVDVLEKAIRVFIEMGIIEKLDNGSIFMLDIQNYIGKSSTEADRKRKYRNRIDYEKQRLNTPKDKSQDKCPVHIELELELELELEQELEIEKKTQKNGFKKPSLSEIENYCVERSNKVNAQQFYDFYESKGWMIGKNKMKDWRACIRTWENKGVVKKETVPEWFDKEIEIKKPNIENMEKINEMLKGYS